MGQVRSSCAWLLGDIPCCHPSLGHGHGYHRLQGMNAEELWVCSAPPTQLRLKEKLSRWRLIIPLPCIPPIQPGDGRAASAEQTARHGFAL